MGIVERGTDGGIGKKQIAGSETAQEIGISQSGLSKANPRGGLREN